MNGEVRYEARKGCAPVDYFGSRGKTMTLASAIKEVIGLTSPPLKPKAAKGGAAGWSRAALGKADYKR